MMRILLWMVMTAVCAGCQSPIAGHQGIDVEVYPVTYLLSIRADAVSASHEDTATPAGSPPHVSQARQVWQQFLARHQHNMLNSRFVFLYAGEAGEKTARRWRDELIAQGADAAKLRLEPGDDLKGFGLQVRLVVYQTVTPFCYPPGVGGFGHHPAGCFVDSVGWLSMVHPEDALPDAAQLKEQGK